MKKFTVGVDADMASRISKIAASTRASDTRVIELALFSYVRLCEMLAEPDTELVLVKRGQDGSALNEKTIVL
jgi:predicted transcriptional regulator